MSKTEIATYAYALRYLTSSKCPVLAVDVLISGCLHGLTDSATSLSAESWLRLYLYPKLCILSLALLKQSQFVRRAKNTFHLNNTVSTLILLLITVYAAWFVPPRCWAIAIVDPIRDFYPPILRIAWIRCKKPLTSSQFLHRIIIRRTGPSWIFTNFSVMRKITLLAARFLVITNNVLTIIDLRFISASVVLKRV